VDDNEEKIECPECGSDLIFDLDDKYECDKCGWTWKKE